MRIGITFGAFDLFHAGHVLMLQEADTVCDYMIVCVQRDPSVDILAGVQWDVRIIGEEYYNAPYTGRDEYKDNRKKEIYYNSRQHRFSSSELRERKEK